MKGLGSSYLVEHSTGSGKSATIAWLAHRLSTLHDEADRKVFDKVVVVTDRLVLDRQLQETIYQLEHAHGIVERIDRDSSQLAAALTGEQARIIITTLQKFPFLLDKVGQLPARRYAVIIDEAHSSQTGRQPPSCAGYSAWPPEDDDLAPDAVEDALADVVAARGRQPNLSLAFTATPKGKTLQLFGHLNPDTGKYEPSHLYSMRQAIEEGFIHDVLANYTTYETFWRIEKTITEDPAFETAKARRAIARFVTLQSTTLPSVPRSWSSSSASRSPTRSADGPRRWSSPRPDRMRCGSIGRCAATSTTRAMTSGCWSRSPGPSATTATR